MTPFRSPQFRRLWCSSLASSGAMGMERTATAWLALEAGGGALAVGLTLAARMLPALMFGLAAGTIADRSDRRRQLIVVAAAALPLVPPVLHLGAARPSFGRALRDAARLVVDLPAVRTLSIAGIVCEVFAFSHQTALPVLARDVLAAGPEGLGTLNGAAQIGGTIAVALLSVLPARVRLEPIMGAVFVLYGAAILTLASTTELAVAAAVMLVTGACAGAFDALQQTLIQLSVPEGQRGRAVGVWVLGLGSAPLGHLEMGAMVAAIGAPGAL